MPKNKSNSSGKIPHHSVSTERLKGKPKGAGGSGGGGGGGGLSASSLVVEHDQGSAFANDNDNASTISNASTNMSYQQDLVDEDGGRGGEQQDADATTDNVDAVLAQCLDDLLEKGFKEREQSLKTLRKLLANKYILEHVQSKRFTLGESLLRCMRRGKAEEQCLAATCMQCVFIQLGYGDDALELYAEMRNAISELISNDELAADVRAAFVRTLGIGTFVTNDTEANTLPVLELVEHTFAKFYAKGNGDLRTFPVGSPMYKLNAEALATWCLLLSITPLSHVHQAASKHVRHFLDFLRSSDVDVRIVAGETIAFLFELERSDRHVNLRPFKEPQMLDTLKELANDSSKHRSKKDKKQQRSSFRDILRTLEGGEFETQQIKCGMESIYLDNWCRQKQYDSLCDVLGNGMRIHLQENEFVREVFDLGAPLLVSGLSPSSSSSAATGGDGKQAQKAKANVAISTPSSKEKLQFNKDQFRSRTKFMNKKRSNKDSMANGDGEDDD